MCVLQIYSDVSSNNLKLFYFIMCFNSHITFTHFIKITLYLPLSDYITILLSRIGSFMSLLFYALRAYIFKHTLRLLLLLYNAL
ncbi:MAG: hypothetical protein EXX96DRAFT_560422 [Benjaminiella poitrasii]|nr:MAG: hypothetical protein EXX96DRAFT_560422 [Benjaminiella poitrasii]